MKLSVLERILIYGMQPPQGKYDLLAAYKKLEPDLRFSEEETRKFDIKQVEHDGKNGQKIGMVVFNQEVAEGHNKEVKIPARIMSYLAEELEKRDDEGTLTFQYLPLYEKFCLKVNKDDSSKQGKSNNK